MDLAASLHLLGLHGGTSSEEIERAFGRKKAEILVRLDTSPTEGLREKYRRQIQDLEEARRVAIAASTADPTHAHPSNEDLPVQEPDYDPDPPPISKLPDRNATTHSRNRSNRRRVGKRIVTAVSIVVVAGVAALTLPLWREPVHEVVRRFVLDRDSFQSADRAQGEAAELAQSWREAFAASANIAEPPQVFKAEAEAAKGEAALAARKPNEAVQSFDEAAAFYRAALSALEDQKEARRELEDERVELAELQGTWATLRNEGLTTPAEVLEAERLLESAKELQEEGDHKGARAVLKQAEAKYANAIVVGKREAREIEENWEEAKRGSSSAAFKAFLNKYPESRYATAAKEEIGKIENAELKAFEDFIRASMVSANASLRWRRAYEGKSGPLKNKPSKYVELEAAIGVAAERHDVQKAIELEKQLTELLDNDVAYVKQAARGALEEAKKAQQAYWDARGKSKSPQKKFPQKKEPQLGEAYFDKGNYEQCRIAANDAVTYYRSKTQEIEEE